LGGLIDKTADQRLLDATLAYVAGHADDKFDAFGDAVANWGEEWAGVAPVHLTASDLLADALALARSGTAERELMSLYVKERASRYWEQSYTAAEKAVGADMLAGYGYTEIVGKRGPYLSERIRAGVGVFAAGVDYPAHRHQAEEIYVVLAGSGVFRLGENPPEEQTAGAVVHITSQLVHRITMGAEPLVIFYLWRGGDLREKSTFV
jgi:quercetin dioxygenase-like cupin family protein